MADDFDLEDFENNGSNEVTEKDKFYNVLGYIPFINISLLFVKNNLIKNFSKRHISQGVAIFLIYIGLSIFLSIINFTLSALLTLFYFILSIYLASKAYNNIYIEIELIEKVIKEFRKK